MRIALLHIVCVLLLLTNNGSAQTKQGDTATAAGFPQSNADFKFEGIIPGNYIYMDVDMLGNIYLITAGNQLKKLTPSGDSVGVFNDVKKFGNPSYIDVTNPLKILVYYKNYATVVILDRLLTQRNTINFRKKNIFSVKAIATSYDNNIWLFDEQDYTLKKIDEEGNVLLKSTDMRQLVDTIPSPQQIIDADNIVYVYDEARGFFLFDYYGALKSSLPFKGWTNVAVSSNKLMGFAENKLLSYELKSLNLKSYMLPEFFKDYDAIKANNGKVYLLKKNAVEIYSVQ